MTRDTFENTIDWDQYWQDVNRDRREKQETPPHVIDAVSDFVSSEVGTLDAFADVGCGSGVVAFEIAKRYPEATVIGYDAAESILVENQCRARKDNVENIDFEQTVLPSFEPIHQFDLVFSYFTLSYVRDVEDAIVNMYDAVSPGGYLIFNYQNQLARSHWQTMAEAPEEYFGDGCVFDADQFEERFKPLLEGESVLSYDRIHEVLGTWPQSIWSIVDKPDIGWSWRYNPLVYVPK